MARISSELVKRVVVGGGDGGQDIQEARGPSGVRICYRIALHRPAARATRRSSALRRVIILGIMYRSSKQTFDTIRPEAEAEPNE